MTQVNNLVQYRFYCTPTEAEKIKELLASKKLPDNGEGVKDLLLLPMEKQESAIIDYIKNNPESVALALSALDSVKTSGAKIIGNFLRKKVGL